MTQSTNSFSLGNLFDLLTIISDLRDNIGIVDLGTDEPAMAFSDFLFLFHRKKLKNILYVVTVT